MKIALLQINTTLGDFEGNLRRISDAYQDAARRGAQIALAPELALCGYPPRDLLLKPSFLRDSLAALDRCASQTQNTALVVGYLGRNLRGRGRPLTNSVALLRQGGIVASRDKMLLPSYDVFDEDRYFEPARTNAPVELDGIRLGLTICEDIWNEAERGQRYRQSPVSHLVDQGAELILNISASPWHLGKDRQRHRIFSHLAAQVRTPLVYCNLVGGNDELVFDGNSMAFNAAGELIHHGASFAEDGPVIDTGRARAITPPHPPGEKRIYQALTLGLRDYLHKCGFRSAVLGLSGGIDSAVTACIAVEALGRDQVRGVSLPSQYSSRGSLEDARDLAANLGIRYDVVAIEPVFQSVKQQLAPLFHGRPEDASEENIQARLRGVILMGLSNKFGSLLLTTGNKSELAVGYCTLYGDMCGGLAVLNDVPKTMVYRLANWINRDREWIPASTLAKPPSAELRPDQTDQDSLPPYEELDAVLERYIVEVESPSDIIAAGFRRETVERIIRLIDRSEYKRRQAAPGLKVTSKAFGMGRRIPIAQQHDKR